MTALNKQALTDESGNILLIVAARMARRELFTPLHYVSGLPQKVVGMRVFREALEQCEEALQREVCRIIDGHNRMAKKLKEAEAKLEAAEKTSAARLEAIGRTHKMFQRERDRANADRDIKALRQRIAELEAREVNLPKRSVGEVMYMSGFSRDYAEGWCAGNDNAIYEIHAAGIGVKGE